MKGNLTFWRSKFCKGEKDCPDRRITQFYGKAGSPCYMVCVSLGLCSLKSDFPVKVEEFKR